MSVTQDITGRSEEQHSFQRDEIEPRQWNFWLLIGFRFILCYFVLYSFIALENLENPTIALLGRPYDKVAQAVVPWVGKHILHMSEPLPNTATGGADDAFSYVSMLCLVVFGAIVTLVWSLLDRKRKQYDRLYDWLRVCVRYVLGFNMLVYGLAKVIQLQFPFPSLGQLVQPFGQQAPAALLWNFMGYSRAYSFFGGALEVIAGAMLFFRRTTTLGALMSIAVLSNIVMLNFCYDVRVKFIASNLLFMSIFLIIPDLIALTNILVFHRPAMPSNLGAPFQGRRAKIGGWAVKTLLILSGLFLLTKQTLDGQKEYITSKSSLYGIYDVEEFIQNGQVKPPLTTDTTRWRKVIFDSPSVMEVELMDDSGRYYGTAIDPAKSNITLTVRRGNGKKGVLIYSRPDADHLVLQGMIDNDSVAIQLQRFDKLKFTLVSSKFRWFH